MQRTKIEWCDMTFNPVTGCNHGCDYCYAAKIAHRFSHSHRGGSDRVVLTEPVVIHKEGKDIIDAFPYGFTPTLHTYRLGDPVARKKPARIFVSSMGDLFGDWVPTRWIQQVFAACSKAPQHQYMFLTKNPLRYTQLKEEGLLPALPHFWYGTTVTNPNDYYFDHWEYHCFLSIEPIQASWEVTEGNVLDFGYIDWVIIGAETGNRKNKIIPKRSWIEPIVETCMEHSIPVFMKDSLIPIVGDTMMREIPGEVQ